jgi:hypothetical protein
MAALTHPTLLPLPVLNKLPNESIFAVDIGDGSVLSAKSN